MARKTQSSTELATMTNGSVERTPELVPYNILGHTAPFSRPHNVTPRLHLAVGKGGGAKTATMTARHSLLSRSGIGTVLAKEALVQGASGRSVVLYDLDVANPSYQRYYSLPDDQVCGKLDSFEMGQLVQTTFMPILAMGHSILGDLGAQGEVAWLDFIEENGLSEILGESVVSHVMIGSLDSVGTAQSVAQRSPHTPVILYLNAKEPELRMVVNDRHCRELLDEVVALPNVLGALDFPDLRAAFAISSRTYKTLYDATCDDKLSLIERQICRAALDRLETSFAPAAAWMP